MATIDIVPPGRMGELLAAARIDAGQSLHDVASRGPLAVEELVALEAGHLVLDEDQLVLVLDGYGLTLDQLVPTRRQVLLDLDRGELSIGEAVAHLDADSPATDEVLGAYLALVCSLRQVPVGTPVVIRGFDVHVLSRALRVPEADVERRLQRLMDHPTKDVGRIARVLRSKFALSVVGAVVVATAVGAVLVLRVDDPPATPPTVTRTVPPPVLIPPQTLEREPGQQ